MAGLKFRISGMHDYTQRGELFQGNGSPPMLLRQRRLQSGCSFRFVASETLEDGWPSG